MKHLIKITVLIEVLLLFVPIIQAQTSVNCDTLLVVPHLTGGMAKYWDGKWFADTTGENRYMWYGIGEFFHLCYGSLISRFWMTFKLPAELEVEELDSAHVYLYQKRCCGDDQIGKYPHWDVPGGDTIFCALDHVQFDTIKTIYTGIDTSFWNVGDPGNLGTLECYAAKLPKDTTVGFKVVDLTKLVKEDLDAGRRYTQYRVAFPIETDDDQKIDGLVFDVNHYNPYHRLEPATFLILWYKNTGVETINSSQLFNDFRLYQNYPNPFNSRTLISYDLPKRGHVKLTIYDIAGREVVTLVDDVQSSGLHQITWYGEDKKGDDMPSGINFYHIQFEDVFQKTGKMILIR